MNSKQQNFTKLWLQLRPSHFATLTVGNISHHIFKMDALYCVKYRGFVKTQARRSNTR